MRGKITISPKKSAQTNGPISQIENLKTSNSHKIPSNAGVQLGWLIGALMGQIATL